MGKIAKSSLKEIIAPIKKSCKSSKFSGRIRYAIHPKI